jgi:trigger factor
LLAPTVAFADEVTTEGATDQEEPEKVTYPAMDLLNTDLSKYISLGQHTDVPITLNVYMTDDELYELAVESNVYTEIKTRESADGDIIKIGFVGNIKLSNGSLLPVQGGSGSGMIELGKTPEKTEAVIDYLKGRAELVGVMPGKTAEITVTFPEDFSESAMAGREVVFTVTVESVIEYGFTDAYVSTKFGCKDIEEFREILIKQRLKNFENELKYDVFFTIMKNSKILMYPEEQYNYYYYSMYNTYKNKYDELCEKDENYANETSFEQYLEKNNLSIEDIEENAKVSVEQDLVYFAIYKSGAVGTMTEADYAQNLADLAAGYGTTSAELETLFAGKHDLMNAIVSNFVYTKLDKLAKLTTDYSEYEHLLKVETTTPPTQGTTAPGANAKPAPCGVDITAVLIIAVFAVGAAVFVALLCVRKKKTDLEEDECEEDEEYEEYEEDSEESDEGKSEDNEPEENEDTQE